MTHFWKKKTGEQKSPLTDCIQRKLTSL